MSELTYGTPLSEDHVCLENQDLVAPIHHKPRQSTYSAVSAGFYQLQASRHSDEQTHIVPCGLH